MRVKELSFVIAFMLVVLIAVACTPAGKSEVATEKTEATPPAAEAATVVPQLEADGREDSATMTLLNAPPMQPADHVDRWNPDLRQESCLACHAVPETGAPTPPADHYYDNDQSGTIFRDSCIQCHATQNDTKPAFNREN